MSGELDSALIDLDLQREEMTPVFDTVDWMSNDIEDCLIDANYSFTNGNAEAKEKQNSSVDEGVESIFATRRPSMLWNTRYRQKEERKKVIRISQNKLRMIDDPELFLRRAVLINNTFKRLQQECKEEKCAQKSKNSWKKLMSYRNFRFVDEYELYQISFRDSARSSREQQDDPAAGLGSIDLDPGDSCSAISDPVGKPEVECCGSPTEKKPRLADASGDSAGSDCDKSSLSRVIDQVLLPYKSSLPSEHRSLGDAKLCNCCQTASGVGLQSVVLHSLIVSLES